MSNVAKVQARGQVTVPQEIREAYHIEPGNELLFLKAGEDHFECRVLRQPGSLLEFIDQHAIHDYVVDVEALREAAADEEGREYLRRFQP
jgi:AbrB family looped-hinge helix DNA binding protein